MFKVTISIGKVKEGAGRKKVRSPQEIYNLCKEIADFPQETIISISMNEKNRVIAKNMISMGIVNASLCHPREVFRAAITDSASAICLVHNHPTGEVTPSVEDLRMTRQLVDASRIIGIKLMDHIIIGKEILDEDTQIMSKPFFSMRESGLVCFDI